MFKNILKHSSIVAIAIVTLVIGVLVGCQKEEDVFPENISIELQNYFNSKDYADLKVNFKFGISNFSFNDVIVEKPISEISIYYLPVKKGDRVGVLAIFSKNNGKVYRSLYEDRSQLNQKDEGAISIYTAKKFFVVDFQFKKTENQMMTLNIKNVGNIKIGSPRLKSGNEFPSDDDPWWSCTTDCYAYAKDACDGTASCQLMCDLLDITGLCTLSVAAACAIYCI
ncbi:MAG: hypothetical protein LBL04_10340 [Bacteroidales bacterium]|jgi:hypothetical protein|nr:hypothetical protein [Bacteroidales bacterium]